jgi:anaerobic selenocysteine-containing dehydrogenase
MHPCDLATRGLADGMRVRIRSRVGEVQTEVVASEAMMPGVVSLPHGFGPALAGSRLALANALDGVSCNDLTDPEWLDTGTGNAALNGIPVQVFVAE